MPAGFVIAEIDIKDMGAFEEYKRLAGPAVQKYGGVAVVRGGVVESLEGDWNPKRLTIVRFESLQRAKEWWDSEEYREAKALREKIASSRILVVEGL